MDTVHLLAEVTGSLFVVVGFAMLNTRHMTAVIEEFAASRALSWLTGVGLFAAGVTMITLYNLWFVDWRVLITLVGWAMAAKGAFLVLFPHTASTLYRRVTTPALLVIGGVTVIAFGAILFCLGYSV